MNYLRYRPKEASNGIKRLKQRAGVSLLELILYMGLSGLVVVFLSFFLTNMFAARAIAVSQTAAQTNARSILERLTVAVRNGYLLEVNGSTMTVWSHPASNPSGTVYTVFRHSTQQLQTGSGLDRLNIPLQSMTAPDVIVTSFSATLFTSAVDIQLEVRQGNRSASLQSTLAYRQIQ